MTRVAAWRRYAVGALLAIVVAAPMVISFVSLTAYAGDELGLTGPARFALAVALDAAAGVMIALRWDATARGDSSTGPTVLFWCLVAGSAAANARHGAAVSTDATVVLAAMPVVAAVVLDVVIRHVRRDVLRQLGAIEDPIARFRLARWLVDRRGTWRAWRTSVLEGETSARRAIDLSRGRIVEVPGGELEVPPDTTDEQAAEMRARFERHLTGVLSDRVGHRLWTERPHPDTRTPDTGNGHPVSADTDTADTRTRPVPPTRPDTGQWDTLADAVRASVSAVGPDTDTVMSWLADNGVADANRDTVRKTINRVSADTRTDKETTT